ncbi:hypothetical protein HNR46_001102 [Haloferula luteola]|uniref:PEP-CTERM protein-sorting domain-containing protein n=1 Tax=Haloferula luteola TaxID=595692 RepID=A0A840V806_9BACT|nr:PEP-CTERM sorting domain-containing protein [Haloferula luteola]MBB5350868.1 hypothetical protein [Haloferula luteola]
MKSRKHTMMAPSLVLLGFSVASAATISWNYDNNGTLASSNIAGVVPVDHWSNSWPDNPTIDLVDDTGAATTLDITTASNSGSWSQGGHPGQDTDTTYNREMLNGYLNGTGANSSSVEISQVPYAVYDLYVYFASDDHARSGTVTDGTTTFSFGVLDGMVSGGNALLVETTDTGTGYPEANYAVFRGLTTSSVTLSTSFMNAGEYGGIAGFQVVSVPEPSVVLLGALGILGIRRRR